jgi:hypothetical protein
MIHALVHCKLQATCSALIRPLYAGSLSPHLGYAAGCNACTAECDAWSNSQQALTLGMRVAARAALTAKLRAPNTLPPSFSTSASTYTTQHAFPGTTHSVVGSRPVPGARKVAYTSKRGRNDQNQAGPWPTQKRHQQCACRMRCLAIGSFQTDRCLGAWHYPVERQAATQQVWSCHQVFVYSGLTLLGLWRLLLCRLLLLLLL